MKQNKTTIPPACVRGCDWDFHAYRTRAGRVKAVAVTVPDAAFWSLWRSSTGKEQIRQAGAWLTYDKDGKAKAWRVLTPVSAKSFDEFVRAYAAAHGGAISAEREQAFRMSLARIEEGDYQTAWTAAPRKETPANTGETAQEAAPVQVCDGDEVENPFCDPF